MKWYQGKPVEVVRVGAKNTRVKLPDGQFLLVLHEDLRDHPPEESTVIAPVEATPPEVTPDQSNAPTLQPPTEEPKAATPTELIVPEKQTEKEEAPPKEPEASPPELTVEAQEVSSEDETEKTPPTPPVRRRMAHLQHIQESTVTATPKGTFPSHIKKR